jgi:hypothetical protein
MKGLTLIPLWLYNPSTTPAGGFHTVYMQQSNIGASVELSHVSVGSGEPAFAGALITRYKHYKQGKLTTVNMPKKWTSNAVFVDNCVEITFGIGGAWAGGHAVARIVYF